MKLFDALVFWNPWWEGNKEWFKAYKRDLMGLLNKLFRRKEILTITGVRRSGKTTILYLLIEQLINSGIKPKNILHINLEDPAFKSISTYEIYQRYLELINPSGKIYLFFDEIQESEHWEKDLLKLYDGVKNIKITITGSNSSVLKGEYSTLLTGRTLLYENYPFSFKEFVTFKGLLTNFEKHLLLSKKSQIIHIFNEYLIHGGFPEVINEEDEKMKMFLLKDYYTAILTRDVLKRYPIRHARKYEKAAHYFISNFTNSFSTKKLAAILDINMHTLEEYFNFLEDVYLMFSINHFSYSLKKQITYPRKIYCIDNGLINAASFKFSEDFGKQLENLVFAEIKRKSKECFYWKGKKECDFLVKSGDTITDAIQVCYSLEEPKTKKREIDGLIEALNTFSLSEGKILTFEEFESVEENNKRIQILPVWYWLLTDE